MPQAGSGRQEAPLATSAITIRGLEPVPSSTAPLDPTALTLEHVLASLARVKARLEENDRRAMTAGPQPPPEPDPPMACRGVGIEIPWSLRLFSHQPSPWRTFRPGHSANHVGISRQ
ncbi:hypothetical protein AAHA92_15377 [Salvia divinorum]|uniref:Uncharacterized protein n=1 Tax=Salvia divinorum TaxID=28513 RepID=A0ABD1HEK0_SALDI